MSTIQKQPQSAASTRTGGFLHPEFCTPIPMHASTPLILRKSRMRRRARTDLCGGRSAMVVPTATVMPPGWQIAPDKRAWSHAFPDTHLILELWRYADLPVLIRARSLSGSLRIADYSPETRD